MKLEVYARSMMECHTQNFGNGIEIKDLALYAKIEQGRSHSHQDRAVQVSEIAKGQAKERSQTHVHIIVSRTENLTRYQQHKQAIELNLKNPLKLSPATHYRNTSQRVVKGGFDRKAFKEAAEPAFDNQFSITRPLKETFLYANVMDKGINAERLAMRQAAQQQKRDLAQRIGKRVVESTAQAVTKKNVLQPQAIEQVSPKLSDREELIKQMLEKLDKPQQNRHSIR